MKLKIEIVGSLALIAVLVGCGKSSGQSERIAQAIVEKPNCDSLRDRVWSELYRQIEIFGVLPEAESVSKDLRASALTGPQGDAFATLYSEVADSVRGLDRENALRVLAETELGDRTDDLRGNRQNRIENALTNVKSESVAVAGQCESKDVVMPMGEQIDPVPMFENWRQRVGSILYGAYKTISVGYQSCSALAASQIKTATAAVSGIGVIGTHSNGVGSVRTVLNASQIYATNPYYASRVSPPSGCFTATKSPIIYDYGGKPYAASTLGVLDLTKNAGSGGPSLGIDCSGFVTSAVMAGGLRLKAGVSSKPAQVDGVSASMLASPVSNGLSCFSPLTSTKTEDLKSGDIVANNGHVFIIDQVGMDPFGIRNAKTSAACDAISAAQFDFSIIQSSASKGGIGMNRFRGADYLASTSSFRNGMLAYAKSFCKVRLGLSAAVTLANKTLAVIIRHKGTPTCLNPEPIPLVGQSCLKSCGPVTASGLAMSRSEAAEFNL